jgi:hypothetical protein
MSKDDGKLLRDIKKRGKRNLLGATKDVENHGGGAKKSVEGC